MSAVTPIADKRGCGSGCPLSAQGSTSAEGLALGDVLSLIYCDRCLDGVVVVERTSPHGSADFFLSGTFAIADLYASSTAFRFSCSSGVGGRLSGARFIPGMNWAEAVPVNATMVALAPPRNPMNSRRLIPSSRSSRHDMIPAHTGKQKRDIVKRGRRSFYGSRRWLWVISGHGGV